MERVRVTVTVEIEVDRDVLQTQALGAKVEVGDGADPMSVVEATADPTAAAHVWANRLQNELVDHFQGSAVAVRNISASPIA